MVDIKFSDGAKGEFNFNNPSQIKIEKVKSPKNSKWLRDEIIITLDFYHNNYPNIPDKNSKELKELSLKLNKLGLKLNKNRNEKYRNTNGVYMKLMNFHSLNPHHTSKGLSGASELDKKIFLEFENDKITLSRISNNIINMINLNEPCISYDEDDDIDYEVQEGKLYQRVHRFRERDRTIVRLKKIKVLNEKGSLNCEGCDFNFKKAYGSHGENFIECHHILPVSKMLPGASTRLEDLCLLCSNCHRMIHRKTPWLSLKELKKLINTRQ